MRPTLAPEEPLVQYLLGRMSERERLELEERLFRDEDLDEELLVTTEDLVCAYLAGELREDNRLRFEGHFLASPENREQLASMRDFLTAMDRVSEEDTPAVKDRPAGSRARALAAAAAVALAFGLVVAMAARRWGQGAEQAAATPLPVAPATPSAQTRPEPPMPRVPPPAAVRVVRLPAKSGAPVNVRLSPSTRTVRAEVTVDQESLSFDAAVRTADGTAVWRAEGLAPSAPGGPLVLQMPAEVFASGRYTLRVEGESLRGAAAPVLEYRLRVVREP